MSLLILSDNKIFVGQVHQQGNTFVRTGINHNSDKLGYWIPIVGFVDTAKYAFLTGDLTIPCEVASHAVLLTKDILYDIYVTPKKDPEDNVVGTSISVIPIFITKSAKVVIAADSVLKRTASFLLSLDYDPLRIIETLGDMFLYHNKGYGVYEIDDIKEHDEDEINKVAKFRNYYSRYKFNE